MEQETKDYINIVNYANKRNLFKCAQIYIESDLCLIDILKLHEDAKEIEIPYIDDEGSTIYLPYFNNTNHIAIIIDMACKIKYNPEYYNPKNK